MRWKQGRSALPAECRLTGGRERVEDVAMLLFERGHLGHAELVHLVRQTSHVIFPIRTAEAIEAD